MNKPKNGWHKEGTDYFGVVVKEEEKTFKNKYVWPKTDNQEIYVKSICKDDMVVCEGTPGSGKTYIAIGMALELLNRRNSPYHKIVISRPIAHCGSDMGFLPGELERKYSPYMKPAVDILNHFLGHKDCKHWIETGVIELEPLEFQRGLTYSNCIVLYDEFQNSLPKQAVMAITRRGHDCKMIFVGDKNQSDIDTYSGLDLFLDDLKGSPSLCAIHKLTEEDNQRDPRNIQILKKLSVKG